MRTLARGLAEALWPKARRRILGLLFARPDEEWHLRDIARQTQMAPATVQREVTSLHDAGILTRRRDGHQVKYGADGACPIFQELHGIVLKTMGLADVLRDALDPVRDRVDVAFVFGSLAAGEATSRSDVDLMIVGRVGLRELVPVVREATSALGREINPVTMEASELRERVDAEEHFITRVMEEPKIFLIGDEDELRELAEREAASAS